MSKYSFDGLYHFTDLTNLGSILESGVLKSRQQCEQEDAIFLDCANAEIIENTPDCIKGCTRFYYKEKTPMLYDTEGIKCDESPPHVPIPVYLIFKEELIYCENTFFSDGNAKSDSSNFGNDFDFFSSMDWDKIFHRGSFSMDMKREYIRKRHAELLCKNPVPISYLKMIAFRCDADKKRAIRLYGNNTLYVVNPNLYYNHHNYITDYSVDLDQTKKILSIHFSFNNYSFRDYISSYKIYDKHNTIVKQSTLTFPDGIGLSWVTELNSFRPSWYRIEYYMGSILCIDDIIT